MLCYIIRKQQKPRIRKVLIDYELWINYYLYYIDSNKTCKNKNFYFKQSEEKWSPDKLVKQTVFYASYD